MLYCLATGEFLKPALYLVSSLVTDVGSIRKNDSPEQQLESRLEMNTVFVRKNNVTALKLESSLVTDVAFIRKNDTPEQLLTSRFVKNAAFILRNNTTALKLASSLNN